jgi:hypothetical protein
MSGEQAGGICGRIVGNTTISYCWNEGDISKKSGGICGSAAGKSGLVTINYCYNTGDFGGIDAGGICGRNASYVNIFNCYNTGTISSDTYKTGIGGIVGYAAGSNSKVTNIYNCYSSPGTSDYWGGDNTGGIAASKSGTLNVYNSYYVYGNDDRDIYGKDPNTNSNNLKSSIWYEGYANNTINSDSSNLSNIGKSSSNLKWYDSFDQAGEDSDFRAKFGDYITTIGVADRDDATWQTKYLEIGLRTKEGNMVDYTVGDVTNGGDVVWDLSGENYFISDAPRIQLQSKTPSEKQVVSFTRLKVTTAANGSSDILVTTDSASGGKSGDIWYRHQTSTEGYKVKVETNYRRGGSDWAANEGDPIDVIKNTSSGWHNDYASDPTTLSYWRVTIQDGDLNNMPNMNPWLITDENTTWGDTSFEDDQ